MSTVTTVHDLANRRPWSLDDRWSYRESGLVHRVLALHHSRSVEIGGRSYPANAIAECGLHVVITSSGGWYVGDDPPTCVLCAPGTCDRGLTGRRAHREATFGMAYGMPVEKIMAAYPEGDAAAAISGFRALEAELEKRRKP